MPRVSAVCPQTQELRHEQQREISTVHAHQQRLDDDALLAFNAEILAFAKSFKVDIEAVRGPPRSRATSPTSTPARRL